MKTLRFFFVAALAMISFNAMADEVTMAYSGSTTTNLTGNNDAALVGLSADEWSVVGAKGGNNNFPGLNKAGDIRLYYHASGGNTITVESLTGATINSITATFNSATYSNMTVTVNGSPVTGTDGTFTINSTSFVLGNGNTTNVQVQIKSLVINYSASSDTRTATTVEFGEGYATRATCGKDESVTLPTCQVNADGTPIDATVEWSIEKKSGNDDLAGAAVSGNTITIPNHSYGELKVTASYKGDAQNKPSSKFYTLTVYKGYMNIAEFLVDYAKSNSEIDATGFPVSFWSLTANEGTITGYNDVTVTYVNGSFTYINDGANDLLLFGNSLGLKQGDVLTSNLGSGNVGAIYGTIQSYYGLLELVVTAADIEFTKKSEGATVTPKTLDIANISDLKNMNAYLKVENAEYVKKSDDGKVFTFKVGTTEFNVRKQFETAMDFEVGAKYTIEGMGAIYVKSGSDPVYQLYYVASEKTAESGIAAVKAAKADGAMFNLAGQQVAKGYKGLVIVNGKKVLK